MITSSSKEQCVVARVVVSSASLTTAARSSGSALADDGFLASARPLLADHEAAPGVPRIPEPASSSRAPKRPTRNRQRNPFAQFGTARPMRPARRIASPWPGAGTPPRKAAPRTRIARGRSFLPPPCTAIEKGAVSPETILRPGWLKRIGQEDMPCVRQLQ
jgi:hypothetical protein